MYDIVTENRRRIGELEDKLAELERSNVTDLENIEEDIQEHANRIDDHQAELDALRKIVNT